MRETLAQPVQLGGEVPGTVDGFVTITLTSIQETLMQPVQLGGKVPATVRGLVTITLRSLQNPDYASTVGWGSTK